MAFTILFTASILCYFVREHNNLLRCVASLEKGLVAAEKSRDAATKALEESLLCEEELQVAATEREKMFAEQLFSTTKNLSDAAGVDFDSRALSREDATLQSLLSKAKGVLSRLRDEETPKAKETSSRSKVVVP